VVPGGQSSTRACASGLTGNKLAELPLLGSPTELSRLRSPSDGTVFGVPRHRWSLKPEGQVGRDIRCLACRLGTSPLS
jgi:hypothetical protein